MSRIVDIEPLLHKYDRMNEGTEFSPIHFINDLMALEQQPCEDCISRQAAIDVVRKWFDKIQLNGDICLDGIISLPSVNPSYNSIKTELKPRTNLARTSQDTISREALRQKLQDHHDFFVNAYGNFRGMSLNDKARVDEIDNCIAMVVNAPSVTPKQKVGKWIDSNIPQEKYVCSECGGACWYYDYEGSVAKSNYCPNCGAKMEVRKNDR